MRVYHIKVYPGRQSEFRKAMEFLAAPTMRHRAGMISFYPGQLPGKHSQEFILVTVWRDEAAEKMHSGKDWIDAIIPAELIPLVSEVAIQAYEGFGIPEPVSRPLFNLRAASL